MAIEVLSHFFKPATVLRNHLSKYEETSVTGLEDVSSFTESAECCSGFLHFSWEPMYAASL